MSTPAIATASAWSPFRHRSFAVLWTATLLSNVGTWMHDVGAGWLMTSLAPSPALVSLVQAATTFPVFLFALPAGALADIVDRRRLLLAIQILMTLIAAALGFVVWSGRITATTLVAFTFAMGVCAAFLAPVWQAIVPQLVPRAELSSAVALNSVGINVSRAIGPALGGVIIVAFGIAWPFLLNAMSFLVVIAALLWWRAPDAPKKPLPAERFFNAMRTGVRYARASPPLKATFARAIAFFLFASAYWALLPLIARLRLAGGAELYGMLVTCIGVGAVTGAMILPPLRERLGADRLVAIGTVLTVATLVLFALSTHAIVAAAASLLAGASWIAVLSSLAVSAQMSLPDWVRARGLSAYNAVFSGAMTVGSVMWGQVASHLGISAALLIAAGVAVVGIALTWRFPLQSAGKLNLAPSSHWPQPIVATDVEQDAGPVMVTVEYRIDPSQVKPFVAAMAELESERRRNGAYAWGLFQDTAVPGRMLEYFIEESWLEHSRHHERVTFADRDLQAQVHAFHTGEEPPRVTHYLAGDASVPFTKS
jgi:MFS family permease